jgi:hypothetical protein
MDRPKASQFLPHTQSDWIKLLGHWSKYADCLEAERDKLENEIVMKTLENCRLKRELWEVGDG